MKIVLLPGLDGTGLLFRSIVPFLKKDSIQVISLPTSGDQSYESLTTHIKDQLPKENFILIAESFSGPIGVNLAKMKPTYLKSIIFVATFMSAPKKTALAMFSKLPIKFLVSLPLSSFFLRRILLGRMANQEDINVFREALFTLPASTIKRRLIAIQSLKPEKFNCDIPARYILATQDYLVPAKKAKEFEKTFRELHIEIVEGPHMILQSRAKRCSEIIADVIKTKSAT